MYSAGLSYSETFTDPASKAVGRKVEVFYKAAGYHSAGNLYNVVAYFSGGGQVQVDRIVSLKAARRVGAGLARALASTV